MVFFSSVSNSLKMTGPAFAEALYQDTAAQIVNKRIDVHNVTRKRLHAIGSGGGYINAAQAMMLLHDEPITPLLDKIKCRVDVIGADQDVFCPRKAADMITGALDDVAYHEIPDAGHLMSVDQPVIYCDTLQKILDGRTL